MRTKRQIEVFSAGCPACDEAQAMVQRLACTSCEVTVLDMHDPAVAAKANSYGIHAVPALLIDGQLASCCTASGPVEATLRAAGIGKPLP